MGIWHEKSTHQITLTDASLDHILAIAKSPEELHNAPVGFSIHCRLAMLNRLAHSDFINLIGHNDFQISDVDIVLHIEKISI